MPPTWLSCERCNRVESLSIHCHSEQWLLRFQAQNSRLLYRMGYATNYNAASPQQLGDRKRDPASFCVLFNWQAHDCEKVFVVNLLTTPLD